MQSIELLSVILLLLVLTTYVIKKVSQRQEAKDEFLQAWKKEEQRLRKHYEKAIRSRFASFKIEYDSEKFREEESKKRESVNAFPAFHKNTYKSEVQ